MKVAAFFDVSFFESKRLSEKEKKPTRANNRKIISSWSFTTHKSH